jgi:hypothetical protein
MDRIVTARPADEAKIIRGVSAFQPLPPSDEVQCSGCYEQYGTEIWRRTTIGPGIVLLLVDDSLSDVDLVATIVHELGHSVTVKADVEATGYPTLNWRVEAAADAHAIRWGFRSEIYADFKRRAWGSYGPWRSGEVFTHNGQRYEVLPNLQCRWIGMVYAAPAPTAKRRPAAAAKRAPVQTSVPTVPAKARPAAARPAASAARLQAVDAELDRLFDQAGEYFTAAELAQHDQLIAERRKLTRRAC